MQFVLWPDSRECAYCGHVSDSSHSNFYSLRFEDFPNLKPPHCSQILAEGDIFQLTSGKKL